MSGGAIVRGDGFAVVYTSVIRNAALSSNARLAYAILATYCAADRSAFPGVALIAEQLGTSEATTKRALRELADAGHLAVRPRFDSTGRQTSNLYVLDPPRGEGVTGDRGEGVTHAPLGGVTHEPPVTRPEELDQKENEARASDADRFAAAVAAEGPQGANVTAKAAIVELHVGRLVGWQVGILHQALMDAEGGVVALAAEAHLADRPAAWFGNQLRAGAHVDPKRRIAPGSDRQVAKAAKARSHAEANERVARFLARAGR